MCVSVCMCALLIVAIFGLSSNSQVGSKKEECKLGLLNLLCRWTETKKRHARQCLFQCLFHYHYDQFCFAVEKVLQFSANLSSFFSGRGKKPLHNAHCSPASICRQFHSLVPGAQRICCPTVRLNLSAEATSTVVFF